jgi:hypothetical protein
MKLFVYDSGSKEVLPKRYEIQTPFPEGFKDQAAMTAFKNVVFNLYDTCAIGSIVIYYDWELAVDEP